MSSPSITTPAPAYEARTVTETTTGLELFGDDKTVVAVRVNGEVRDLHLPFTRRRDTVEPVSIESDEGLRSCGTRPRTCWRRPSRRRHTDARLGIGPPITDGFYYDFDVAEPFTPEDLKNLEKAMIRIVKERQRFRRRVVSDDEAREELAAEPYKLELIADKGSASADEGEVEVGAGELTIYDNLRRDDSVGLEGPVPRTARAAHGLHPGLRADPVLGGVLAGRPGHPQLQRIYGTAWPSRDELKAYQFRQAEAAKRDHRKLGRDSTCSPSPTSSVRDWRCSTPRAACSARRWRTTPGAARRGGLRVRQHPAHHQGGTVPDLRPPRLLRRRHVPADAPR